MAIKITTTAKIEIKDDTRIVHPGTDSADVFDFTGEADGGVFSVPNGTVDLQVEFNFSMIKRLYFKSDRAIDIRIVYDGSNFLQSPVKTLVAGFPYLDAGRIIGVYVSNSTGIAAKIEMAAGGTDEAGVPGPATITIPGNLVIPGKLTVGGLIDPPTGLQLEPRTTQGEVDDLPTRTIFVDARAAEALSYKDDGGTVAPIGSGGGGSAFVKYVIDFADVAANSVPDGGGGYESTVNLSQILVGQIFRPLVTNYVTVFDPPVDALQLLLNGAPFFASSINSNFGPGAKSIDFKVSSTADLALLTAGQFDVWLEIETLP